jgi:AraC family transcriptional regulator
MPRKMQAPTPQAAPASRQQRLIGRALTLIEQNLSQPLDAGMLADHAALSRHHFHRVFQALMGQSVAEYITARRLQRACALLVSGRESVADIAWAVGYESAQALAKAMRREMDATPSQVRRGHEAGWERLLRSAMPGSSFALQPPGDPVQPVRFTQLPKGLQALTATARGMVGQNLHRAAKQAFGELIQAVGQAGLIPQVRSCIALVPDEPQGPDDPQCRYVAGVLFGYALAQLAGQCEQPRLSLSGSLAWWPVAAGRYAVFSHIGPYARLHDTWDAIYRDWLPASGEQLRDIPPMELSLNSPEDTPPERLHTEIWLPLR